MDSAVSHPRTSFGSPPGGRGHHTHRVACVTALLGMLLGTVPAAAQTNGAGTFGLVIGENTETQADRPIASGTGFSISVDGQRVAGDETPVDIEQQTDLALRGVDIQVKYDGLGA